MDIHDAARLFQNSQSVFWFEKALKKVADSQKLKDCVNSSNTKSDAALFVPREKGEEYFR